MVNNPDVTVGNGLPIIELEQTENQPLIEILKPDSTTQVLCDVDLSLLDPIREETPGRVGRKVAIINQALVNLARTTDHQILFSLLTQKPYAAFENGGIYGPLLKIQSVRRGQTDNGQSCFVTTPLLHAYCEFGAVTMIKDWSQPGKIIVSVDADYLQTANLLREFEAILKEHILSAANQPQFQLEPGNFAYTAIQMFGGEPMPMKIKVSLQSQIQALLIRLGRQDILDALDVVTVHNDLDFPPHKLNQLAKTIGIDTDTRSKHEQGYPWFGEGYLVIVDDKFHAAGNAAARVLQNGGAAIAPANADEKLKQLLAQYQRGYVSEFPTFLGVLDGLHWLGTGRPLPQEKITQIKAELD